MIALAQYYIDNLPAPIDFQEDNIIQRTLQNAKNLLMCSMGEVPYDRSRGLDPALFDMTYDDMMDELLPELDRLMIYEPDVAVVDAIADRLPDNSTYIRCTLEISINE